MKTSETPADRNPPHGSAESPPIPAYDRVVLWLFLIAFVVFGAILIGDLVSGFFR